MARKRKAKAKKERPLAPEDVLDGRVEFRPEDLFDLIHQVNPTGKKLPKKEEARRYELKRRLQSLLIRRFGDEHVKVEATGHEGLVSLDHVSGARDACHAKVADLEADARAWVRRRLDLAAAPPADEREPWMDRLDAEREPAGEPGADELLERGRQAIAEYDYESARRDLERAFALGRSTAAAVALLELQVDLLGMDAAALELEPQLSAAAREHPAVRTLLALAAARLGHGARARALLEGLTPAVAGHSLPRAAEVYAALAAQAIRDRDRRAAARHLERVAEHDPTHPEIARLTAEVAELRAAEARTAEAELERRYREQGAFAVEDEARALAGRWPDSDLARRILREVAAQRREAEIARHLELADQAFAGGRFGAAARHYEAARDAGGERSDLANRIEEARERQRRRRERQQLDDVLGRFAAGQTESALLAYLALAKDLRARIRERRDRPALAWLDEAGVPPAGAKAQAAVTAVLALERAVAALERGDARAARDELEPHRAALRGVERAREVGREIRARLAAERRRRARDRLEAALAAFAEARLAPARELLDGVAAGELDDADRSRARRLEARLRQAEETAKLAREYAERRAAEDLTGALDRARKLARRAAEGGERERWQASVAELRDRIRAAWRLAVVTGEAPLAEAVGPSHFREKSVAWLDDAGREMVLAAAYERWLFLTAIDLERGRVTERVSARTPRPLEHPLLTCRFGDRLWVSGRFGDVVEIARRDWSVAGFYPLRELVSDDRSIDGARVMPGGRLLWMHVTGTWGEDETYLADLEEWRVIRQLPGGLAWLIPIVGRGEPRMLFTGPGFGARLYTARGELASSERLLACPAADAAAAPDGDALLVLADREKLDLMDPSAAGGEGEAGGEADKGMMLLRFEQPAPEGAWRPTARLELPGAHRYGHHSIVTSVDRCLAFVLLYQQDDTYELLVFSDSPAGRRLEPLYRAPMPGRTTLAHDWHARQVVAARFDDDGVTTTLLGAAEPDAAWTSEAPPPPDREVDFPSYKAYASCGRPTGAVRDAIRELVAELKERGYGERRSFLDQLEYAGAGVDEQVRAVLAVQEAGGTGEHLERTIRKLARQHPAHVGVTLLLAGVEAQAERWQQVRRLLARTAPGRLDGGRARHLYHLKGLAFFHTGQLKKAHAAFKKALTFEEGSCGVRPLLHLTQPMTDPPEASEWAPDQPRVRRLVGAMRTADRAYADGDLAAARATLDRPDLRWTSEVQIAARRANVYLDLAAATAAERFRKRAALAFYRHVRRLDDLLRREILLPGLTWDAARLESLDRRVRDALDDS